MIQNERQIEAQEQKLDSYTGGRNAALSDSLLLWARKLFTISTSVDETDYIKATTLANGIMNKDDIISWGKEYEEILISNECNLIGWVQKFNEYNWVLTDVTSLKGVYDASILQEE